jgi:hypothetical protein
VERGRWAGMLRLGVWVAAAVVWVMALSGTADNGDEDVAAKPETRAAGSVPAVAAEAKVRGEAPGKAAPAEVVGFGSHESRYYEFVFRESQRARLMPMLAKVDGVYRGVEELFQSRDLNQDRLLVDVASLTSPHAAGQTNWTKISLPLKLARGAGDFRVTLRHETVHVFIEQLSGGYASDYFNALRCFHEGVATLGGISAVGKEEGEERARLELWAAATDARGRVPLNLLCDDGALCKKRETFVVYPLGLVLAEALQAVGGAELLRGIPQSLQQAPPAPGADGESLWRHMLQHCGTSYDVVLAEYCGRLEKLKQREALALAALPRLTAAVTVEGAEIVIRVRETLTPEQWKTVVCSVEQDVGLMTLPVALQMTEDRSFRLPNAGLGKLRYLLGVKSTAMAHPAYEPWVEAVLR